MRPNVMLTITSLLSILFFSLHWADEVARGLEPGTMSSVGGLAIIAVWLCGTLVLTGRRLGLVIVLLASILGAGVPVLHMQGTGWVGGKIAANSSGALFWVWTNIALSGAATLSLVLAARELWSRRRGRSR